MTPNIDTLLDTLKQQIESRNAIDFLEDITMHYSGYLGTYLVQKQMAIDNPCDCDRCNDPLDNDLLEN